MKIKVFILFFCVWVLQSNLPAQEGCPYEKTDKIWQAKMPLNDSVNLEFYFRMFGQYGKPAMEIYNAEEVIRVDELIDADDSLGYKLPVFDSELRFKYINKDFISGIWINYGSRKKYKLNWTAVQAPVEKIRTLGLPNPVGNPTNNFKGNSMGLFNGKWEVEFNPEEKSASYKAIGLFKSGDCMDRVFGTFLTESGDYRFLSGSTGVAGLDTVMTLSCFDGAHAFVFKTIFKKDQTISGDFYAGPFGHEKWIGRRNPAFELRNEDSLTFLKPGFDHLDFTCPGIEGHPVSLSDEKYKGKVVIIQIMGSWCPNCMDETRFLSGFYKENSARGLEIIGLAYERTNDLDKAIVNVQRLKKRFDAGYDFLIAATSSDKTQVAKTLPGLTEIQGFPTTIYLDKKGKVRKISTGFNGPATGSYYDAYVRETNSFVNKLLGE